MIRFGFIAFFLIAATLIAQSVDPRIKVEVLSESKNVADENQYIQVQIFCQTSGEVQAYFMRFENTPVRWTVVSADLNGEQLWLLNAQEKAARQNVLTWNFNETASQLALFPSDWQSPYVLNLQLQIYMNERIKTGNVLQEKIITDAELTSGIFRASPAGRGDIITLR